jgi:quercetin dioxygenase-like cupin family protein
MSLQVRRVVTGHDGEGRAVVKIDELAQNVRSGRPNHEACVVWTTESFPVNNNGDEDANETPGTTLANGTVFRVIEYGPGVAPRRHRTDSIDYAVVISGEIDMELDGAEVVHLKAGDVLVQRGTVHNWVNNGSEPCVIAFVLIDAKPVSVSGRTLEAVG